MAAGRWCSGNSAPALAVPLVEVIAMSRHHAFFAALAIAMLIAVGVSAQTTDPSPPPLPPIPPTNHDDAAAQPAPQQAAAPQQPADDSSSTLPPLPPLPLSRDGIFQVQSQLIALGFDPGGADGVAGPATLGAVQQYNESRGGTGRVPIDGRLLARLQQDTGPRLTPDQVAARTQPRYQAPAGYGAPNPAAILQQFQSTIGALINGGGY
jgi:hypothetical protein